MKPDEFIFKAKEALQEFDYLKNAPHVDPVGFNGTPM
jgi:hypothetical protein